MLHIDGQESSIDASDQFHVAVTANTGQVSQHVGNLAVHHRPESELDDRAVHIRNRVGEWITDFVTARNGHSGGTNDAVREAVNALYNADIDSGAGVRSA
ncbi:hypothetical protein C5E45_33075 [Nocardia nova]|uniref:Uncharacterized protein n=1 Tax=Nocardia nova TaxID=37330 RepID=A0A2S6ACM0_9NOCA|nr:hypothetical protein [Nocardia nova]PPJ19683.1 hypothetical protein C5E41_30815 [Nocardia nova]PPJ31826.1 hypothetical protein C5E45_33075 [Nocardia nova]